MLVAADTDGQQVLAWRADPDGLHFCPECAEPVFIKECIERITHFSHYPDSSCGYGTGEGVRHLQMKAAVMDEAAAFEGVRFEAPVVAGRRADVVIPEAGVVVECQASPMRPHEWLMRTRDYSEAGWAVLWVWDVARIPNLLLEEEGMQDCICLPREIPKEIRLCHRACYGQVTAYSPETTGWYSVHIDYLSRGARCVMYNRLGEEKAMLKESNLDGLQLVNLTHPWWKKRSRAA